MEAGEALTVGFQADVDGRQKRPKNPFWVIFITLMSVEFLKLFLTSVQ